MMCAAQREAGNRVALTGAVNAVRTGQLPGEIPFRPLDSESAAFLAPESLG
jgi:hypothetical protein